MSSDEWTGEDELAVCDSLEWETFKSASKLSIETGLAEDIVVKILDSLIESKFAIEKKGSLYRHIDLDSLEFEEMFEDE